MDSSLPVPNPKGAAWALFLDVDGTLLDLVEHPDAVIVPEGLSFLLSRLKHSLNGALALISGRGIASLDALLGEAGLDAAGCHGALLRLNGRMETLGAAQPILAQVAGRLADLADPIPLAMVEVKTHSIAFHYREPVLDKAGAWRLVANSVSGFEDQLRLLGGKQVVEILPQGVGKGQAIARFMDQPPYRGRLPVFVGDDITDEEGFVEVNRRGGISIRVGNVPSWNSAASRNVDTVSDVLAWLAGPVCDRLGCSQAGEVA